MVSAEPESMPEEAEFSENLIIQNDEKVFI